MTALDRLIPQPRRHELDHVDLAAPPAQVWQRLRHGALPSSRWTEALFALRTLPERLGGRSVEPGALVLDRLKSTPERPGFQVLVDDPPREVAVGAIGQVWRLAIPFVHVDDANAYANFAEPGQVRVAWALRVLPLGERDTRLEMELRVDATDPDAWRKFTRYFHLIGPASRLIRRGMLASLQRELGVPAGGQSERPLPGDDLLPDAQTQVSHSHIVAASPEQIWPWLVQMGCGRAGFYSIDLLDNGGVPSAREIHPELQDLHVGQVLPATPRGTDGFEVLKLDAPRALVLGGLYDPDTKRQLPFDAPRPSRFWQVTWVFALEPLAPASTLLQVRVRAAHSPDRRLHALWIRPVHEVMQRAQLRNLAARAEGRLPADGWRDVVEGLQGVGRMALDFVTPRRPRQHWGLGEREAQRPYPGDSLVPQPRWTWTHAVDIEAPAEQVWPWVAQIGADRGGFYSYQWLENLAGCHLRNAETLHPEWQVRQGDGLVLHPDVPPLKVVELHTERHFVAFAAPEQPPDGEPWVKASWLFLLEPLGPSRCRFVSRYRVATSADLRTRATFGPALVEPIGFAMDRKMLLGVKQRAEQQRREPPPTAFA